MNLMVHREVSVLNFQGFQKAKRAVKTFHEFLSKVETAQRSDVRKLFRDVSCAEIFHTDEGQNFACAWGGGGGGLQIHGADVLHVRLRELWARNPRAWRSITKVQQALTRPFKSPTI
jgi:hypothetical protein